MCSTAARGMRRFEGILECRVTWRTTTAGTVTNCASRSLLLYISPGISGRFHSLRFSAADQFKAILTSASVILLDGLSSLRLNQLMTIGA